MFVLDKSGHLCKLRGESTGVLNWTQGSTWFRYFACLLQSLQLFNILQCQRLIWDPKKYKLQTLFIIIIFFVVQKKLKDVQKNLGWEVPIFFLMGPKYFFSTDVHGDSMTELSQWGRFSENDLILC